MTNTRCELLPWILFLAAGAAFLGYTIPILELKLMYLLSAVTLLAHAHYGSCVVSNIWFQNINAILDFLKEIIKVVNFF